MAKSKSSSKSSTKSSPSPLIGPVVAIALTAVLMSLAVNTHATHDSQTGPRHANKPFPSFEAFFPFYLTGSLCGDCCVCMVLLRTAAEHSDPTCRLLHVIGTSIASLYLLMHPLALSSILSAVRKQRQMPLSGYSYARHCRRQPVSWRASCSPAKPTAPVSLARAATVVLTTFFFVARTIVEALIMAGLYLVLNYATQRRLVWQPLIVGYAFAWVGHFAFEHNRPATFLYPSYSLASDYFMLFNIFAGRIPIGY